jgi:hypothetical protein
MLSPGPAEAGILPFRPRAQDGARLTQPAGPAHYRWGGAGLAATEGT